MPTLQHEARVLAALAGVPVVPHSYGIGADRAQSALILEYIDAESLSVPLNTTQIVPTRELLVRARSIVEGIEAIHHCNVTHNDLQPSNILMGGPSVGVRLIDFAHSRLAAVPTASGGSAIDSVRGNPYYRAPEHTGLLRRTVDYRSDYYALGVVLYEQATARLPFVYDDALELAHAHAARRPIDPREFNAMIPAAYAAIILKLLAKDAQDRYQSGAALQRDLERCGLELAGGRSDFDFALAEHDQRDSIAVPQRLYGRQLEFLRLEDVVARVLRDRDPEVVALEGPAGVGKSTLAAEPLSRVRAHRGWYVVAKFAEPGTEAPYAAIGRILDSLVRQLLSESRAELEEHRAQLHTALPYTANVLVEFCPALTHLVGTTQPLNTPDVPPDQARIRLHEAVGAFLAAIVRADRPLYVVLDDAHLASPDSFALLSDTLRALRGRPVILVMPARTDVPEHARYRQFLDGLRDEPTRVTSISLDTLNENDVAELLRDTFDAPEDAVRSLSSLVQQQTAGNPFFIRSFLQAIHADGMVQRDNDGTHFDFERIRSREPSGNVVALLQTRMTTLAVATQHALSIAAVLGYEFNPTEFVELSADDVPLSALWPAIEAQLLICFPRAGTWSEFAANAEQIRCRFAHDNVRQAALSLREGIQVQGLHRRRGTQLLAKSGTGDRTAALFEVVSHMNSASSLLVGRERTELAGLNLHLSRHALSRGAASAAASLTNMGLALLNETDWASSHELFRDLHLCGAEAAFALADPERVEALCEPALQHARTQLEVARVLRLRGRTLQTLARGQEAIALFVRALAALDVRLELAPSPEAVAAELALAADALAGRSDEAILGLPACSDERATFVVELLSRLMYFAYSTGSALFSVALCRMVCMSIQHGHAPESVNGYTFYGVQLAREGKLEDAVRFARIALQLAAQQGHPGVLSQTHLYANLLVMHWKTPLAELAESFRIAHRYAVETGSPGNLACTDTTLSMCLFWDGASLSELMTAMEPQRVTIERFRQRIVLNWHEILMQVIGNLRHGSSTPSMLMGPFYDERDRLSLHIANNDHSALYHYHVAKLLLGVLYGIPEVAFAAAEALRPYRDTFTVGALWCVPVIYFECLARLASCNANSEHSAVQCAEVRQLKARLEDWSKLTPDSGRTECLLATLEAEHANTVGDADHAAGSFAKAVELARRVGSARDVAITCELAAANSLRRSDMSRARAYLRSAQRAYFRWGASGKVRALEDKYPGLLQVRIAERHDGTGLGSAEEDLDELDLLVVLNATRAFAGEIRLDALLSRLMMLLVQTAGATSGYLLLERDSAWRVAAAAHTEGSIVASALSSHDVGAQDVADSGVVSYVAATGETVLAETNHASDSMAGWRHAGTDTGSIACIPLKHQGVVRAIAYLRNEHARGGIARSRLGLLEILSTQAVISLDNARMYAELEDKVAERTRQLETRNAELANTMNRLVQTQRKLVAQEKLAALGALTAGIAHEIKNPLNFVVNFADVAESMIDEVEALRHDEVASASETLIQLKETVSKIRQHGRRAVAIVNDMSMHARRSEGRRVATDVASLLRDRARRANLAGPLAGRGVVSVMIESELPTLQLVAVDIERVVDCLLTNALHSVEDKQHRVVSPFAPVVKLCARTVEESLEIRVIDNGVGVPRDIRDRIFLPFFTTKSPGRGTGLGLSLSHDIIVRVHGGDLRIESDATEDTHFVIELPLADSE